MWKFMSWGFLNFFYFILFLKWFLKSFSGERTLFLIKGSHETLTGFQRALSLIVLTVLISIDLKPFSFYQNTSWEKLGSFFSWWVPIAGTAIAGCRLCSLTDKCFVFSFSLFPFMKEENLEFTCKSTNHAELFTVWYFPYCRRCFNLVNSYCLWNTI